MHYFFRVNKLCTILKKIYTYTFYVGVSLKLIKVVTTKKTEKENNNIIYCYGMSSWDLYKVQVGD